uniref:Vacuolar protein 8 n=1 Tax=Haptolina ericina TaxID=156174 RepID=A0A7S3B0P1_9EUKA|mmetsp:Transcript_4468/g.9684  ORF Transcript_4468/g.9684 Transcript_4468/m.9684 type:complete len:420 (+) Transcript_4468:206-1465(+)
MDETLPLLVRLLQSPAPPTQLAALNALNELLYENGTNQAVVVGAGVVEPAVRLARSESSEISGMAASLLSQIILAETTDATGRAPVQLTMDARLQTLSAMALSSSPQAHAIAAIGLATMCNTQDANLALISQVALPSLLRISRSAKPDTQAPALDALSILAELPQVQVDLVRMGAVRLLLERASTPGRTNADIRTLSLATLQHIASNGSNMVALRVPEVGNRLRGLASSMPDEPAVARGCDTILRSIQTITSLLELQGKQRPLQFGEVQLMMDSVSAAGVNASISREVAHTCAAIGAQRGCVDLFIAEGGIELLNELARAKSAVVQTEVATALLTFSGVREAHRALFKQGGLRSLVALAHSQSDEIQRIVSSAFGAMADGQAPKTWLVQSGVVPCLLQYIRNGAPDVQYVAAKSLLYLR